VDGVGFELDFDDMGLRSMSILGPTILDAVLLAMLSLVPLRGLMVVAGFGILVGHRRKPCKALAVAGDDDVLDATKCPSFLVTKSRLCAQLVDFSNGTRFSSWSSITPYSPVVCLSPPLSHWLLIHCALPGLRGLLDT
jgi:hypothetical protein